MAADQRRKRLNGASLVNYGSPEQHRTKKRNLGLTQSALAMKSHVSVEWDGNHQRVVAKREQIGISRRQMRPFVDLVHNGHNVLADVLAVPPEIFELDSLSEVLSYEVWNTYLSDSERNLLMQFLPIDSEPQQVVQELLSGDNFNFGNPLEKWGASLCSGDLHPDIIVNQEQLLKSDKRAYYSMLHNYHNDMIGFLLKLKERWESCKDPEKEIVHNIRRSKKIVEKRTPSNLNARATSESCSWGAEEKAYSDNHISSIGQGYELQRRVLEKSLNKGKPRNLMVSSDGTLNAGARPKNGDKLRKLNIHASDGDKYMSYIKISKKQHELVKSMKSSGRNIQSNTLNRVLGDLNNVHVQPYEVFVKEEQKKLHEHWLQLVNKDLPVAFANWTERLIQKHAIRNSLVVEMKDKSKPLVEDEDIVSSGIQPQDLEGGSPNDLSSPEDQEDVNPIDRSSPEDNDQEGGSQSSPEDDDQQGGSQSSPEDDDQEGGSHIDLSSSEDDDQEGGSPIDLSSSEEKDDPIAISPENQSLHNSYHSDNVELNHLSADSGKDILSTSGGASQNKAEYLSIMNSQNISISEKAPLSSDGHGWRPVEIRQSYYDSAVSQMHTADGLSLMNPGVNEEQQNQLISQKSDLHQEDTGKELLHRQSNDGPSSSYQSQDQMDLLQSLFKANGVNSYHHEHKDSGFDFQTPENVILGNGQFSSHFNEPLQASLDHGLQRRANEVFAPENVSNNVYSDGGRYLIPSQNQLPPLNMTDWTVNAPPMVSPSQSHVNTGDFIGRDWFSTNQQVHGGWNGSDSGTLSSQSLVTGRNSDQSLFNVLSQYGQLQSGSPYGSVARADQFLPPNTFGGVNTGSHRTNAVVPPSSQSLNYFGGSEAPAAPVSDNMAWMSLPTQNPMLRDTIGNPHLRSWNR